ncbi:polyamine transporter tpo5 [Lecanora helva]
MNPNTTGVGTGLEVHNGDRNGSAAVDNDTGRRKSAFRGRRKSSAVVDESPQAVVEASELSAADRRLAEMGYIQVYKREFSWLSTVSFAVSVSGLYASVSTTFIYPFEAGGASSAVWCWLVSGFGCYCIALSVAELVSSYPTSGGLYFTCKYLAPENWVPEISWLCGWLNLLGQVAGAASTEYGCAQLLLAAVSMNGDFTGYIPTNRQTVGVMAAFTLLHAALNSLNTAALEKITKTYVIFHVAILLSCCVTLLALCDYKHSSSYTWTTVENNSGWTPTGWSFMFGFLGASWTMTDYDATAHIAEEIKNPEIKAPWSIALALGFTWIGGWLYTIVLAYCSGDPTRTLDNVVDQPVAQIFYDVIGKKGGIFFTVAACFVLNFTAMTAIQAGARTIWAFSRDEMLPGSHIWAKIWKKTDTPVYAVWLFCISCVLINLIGLGSYTAISAIFNLTAIALDWSYCIPVICKLLYGKFERGPFHLGWASVPINVWAVTWTTFVTIIYVMPTIRPVTPENMNYVSVLMVAVALFAIIYWYAAGQYYYIGPRTKAQLILGVNDEDVKAADMSDNSSGEKRELHGQSRGPGELAAQGKPPGELEGEGKSELQ